MLGDGHGMLWHVPADFQHFKETTIGCPIIMGRASYQALGHPLPGRTNIVISRSPSYSPDGVVVAHSIEEALRIAEQQADEDNAPFIWITGGGQVYAATIDLVDELVVTDLDMYLPGSAQTMVTAPAIDPKVWEVDAMRSDSDWRAQSGDARWKVTTYVRRA